jgi:nitrite reductase/ring-hydroxylating ferredoxin subunit
VSTTAALPDWPETLTRVPYWAFQREDVYAAEQEKLFRGPCWNYLCLEAEVASPGQYCTSYLGDLPVIVARDQDGELYAFENRCAHRGALLALDNRGTAKDFTCVYHAWSYNLQGDLTGVAFEGGIKGKGGMPESFCKSDHAPRKLRLAVVHGLVFGSLSDDVDDIEDYLGDEIMERIERVLGGRTRSTGSRSAVGSSSARTAATTSATRRSTATPSATPPMPSRTSAPTAASGWPIPRCWTASARSATTPRSRSCRRSPRSCCSRSRTRWRCARSCRVRSTGPS